MATETVAFLFVDLVGSTDLLHRIGDDANDELTRRYQAHMQEAVHRHGGEVLRTMGDGLVVVFTLSAAAAVASAIDMQRAVDRMGRDDPLLRLQIRVGISVGEASRLDDDWSGTPLFEAARLESKARPGTILVNDVVRVLLGNRGGFEFTPVGALELKGFPEPLPASEVAWEPDPGSPDVPLPSALESSAWPLVGRADEMARLEQEWTAVVDGGGARLVCVVGERGMGTSRLAAEMADRVQRGFAGTAGVALYGRADDDPPRPLGPFADALRWWAAAVTPERLRAVVGPDAATLVTLVPSLSARLPELVGPSTSVDAERLADAVVAVVARATAGAPMLMVIDAADAADERTVAVAERLVATDAALLIVGLAHTAAGLASPTVDATERVELTGLADDAVGDLLSRVLARQGGSPDRLSADVVAQVRGETGGSPRLVIETGERLAASGALGGPDQADAVRRALAGASPYKGLLAYQADDADQFFGRDDDVAAVLGRVAAARLLAVVGASGSGKSSLVRAGLLPALARGALAGSATWPVVLFNAGPHPLLELAGGLAGLTGGSVGTTMAALESGPTGLDEVLQALDGTGGPARVVLVVDQFEEIFTACQDDGERERFVETLLHGATVPGGRALVVLVLRADFYGQCAALGGLAAALESTNVLLGPMDDVALRSVIEGPARRAGLDLEPGLADRMVRDVSGEPGALPLLSHALYETWERREHRTLTLAGYRDAGGARGAIAHTAETVYEERLDADQRRLAHDLFLRLTELGEGTEDTRRRVERAELTARAHDDRGFDELIELLVDARLLIVSETTVEVAHEALIREWPRLRDWLDEDRDTLRTLRSLDHAATEWDLGGRDAADLYRGPRLAAAVDAATKGPSSTALTETEAAFLAASQEAEAAERRAAEEQAAVQARQNRRLRRLLAGVGVLLVLALAASLIAVQQRSKAAQRTADADFQRLVSQSLNVVDSNNSLGFLLALEAVDAEDVPVSRSALLSTLERQRSFLGYNIVAAVPTQSALLDDHTAVYGTAEGQVGFADLDSGLDRAPLVRLGDRPRAPITVWVADDPSRRPTAPVIVARADTGRISRIDPATHAVSGAPIDAGGPVFALATSERLGLIAAGRADGTVGLWRLADGRAVGELPAPTDPTETPAALGADDANALYGAGRAPIGAGDPVALAFSPTAPQLAVQRPDGAVEIWDAAGQGRQRQVDGDAVDTTPSYGVLRYRPDGRQVIEFDANSIGGIRAIDPTTARVEWTVPEQQGTTMGLAYRPDGDLLYTTNVTGLILARDPDTGRVRTTVADAGVDMSAGLMVTSDSEEIVATSFTGRRLGRWSLSGSGAIVRSFGRPGQIAAGLSPDGRLLLAASGDQVPFLDYSLWDPANGRALIDRLPMGLAQFSGNDRVVALFDDLTAGQYDVREERRIPPRLELDYTGFLSAEVNAVNPFVALLRSTGSVEFFDTDGRSPYPPLEVDVSTGSVHLSGDNRLLAADSSAANSSGVSVYDVRTGDRVAGPIPDSEVSQFSTDGESIYVSSPSGAVRQLALPGLREIRVVVPSGQPAIGIGHDRDDTLVLVSDVSQHVRLYDSRAQTQLGDSLQGSTASYVFNGELARSGEFMALGGPDGLEVWDLQEARWRTAACRLAGRNLTQQEWDTYLPNAGAYRKTCPQWPAG